MTGTNNFRNSTCPANQTMSKYYDPLKTVNFFLYSSGMHYDGNIFHKLLLFINILSLLVTGYWIILLFVYNEVTMGVFVKAIESLFIIVHALEKYFSFCTKWNEIRSIVATIKHFWSIEDFKGTDVEKPCLETLKLLKIMNYMFIGCATICLSAFLIRPYLLREDYLLLECYVPASVPFVLVIIAQNIALIAVGVNAVAFDMLLCDLFLLGQLQFALLNYRFSTFNTIRNEHQCLKEINTYVDYHNILLVYIKSLNKTYGRSFLLHLFSLIFALCVELYIISSRPEKAEMFKCLMYVIILTFEFCILYCVPAQYLIDEASKINQSVYECFWYNRNIIKLRKSFLMIIVRGNKAESIHALGFVNINHELCVSVFKTILSFYTFLQTLTQASQKK